MQLKVNITGKDSITLKHVTHFDYVNGTLYTYKMGMFRSLHVIKSVSSFSCSKRM